MLKTCERWRMQVCSFGTFGGSHPWTHTSHTLVRTQMLWQLPCCSNISFPFSCSVKKASFRSVCLLNLNTKKHCYSKLQVPEILTKPVEKVKARRRAGCLSRLIQTALQWDKFSSCIQARQSVRHVKQTWETVLNRCTIGSCSHWKIKTLARSDDSFCLWNVD